MKISNRNSARRLGYFLLITGVGHFIFPEPLDQIVPPGLPFDARFWTYLSGVAEITVAIFILQSRSTLIKGKSIRLLGLYLAFLLFVLVYPANIYMAITWSDRPINEAIFAYLRLPLQFALFYWCFRLIKEESKEQLKN